MSQHKFDSNGFQMITRSKKNKSTKVSRQNTTFTKENIDIDIEKAHRRILSCVEDLKVSSYLKDIICNVSNILRHKEIVEIVSFGLGRVGECKISQYQLALLVCLKDTLNEVKVSVHDPIFSNSECILLKSLDFNVIEENNEGCYIISEKGITLVYLPHCPKQLTNNFLWSNWGLSLQNCILFCNSIASLIENQPSRIIKDIVPQIYKIYPLVTEIKLENNFIYKDIFNDIAIHYFNKEKFHSLPSEFWTQQEKPKYENAEEYITTLMIDKLSI